MQGAGGQPHGASFAGDIPVEEAWAVLRDEPDATLIDVRTDAEWSYVGVPDLTGLGKHPLLVSWQRFPDMAINAEFIEMLHRAGLSLDAANLFICRSGARSRAAALAMTAEGFSRCYNVAEGFEGDKDASQHRGTTGGWKAVGLPWIQS
ncbi:MAG: rhodanese-like domain-containing protein [Rhodospirillaceae bacterium]|nr:rhodanese-like domain-containing protein [Rhodospirillaceae bacterium]